MPKAEEGLTLEFKDESDIRVDLLETFPYDGNPQKINYTTSEFQQCARFRDYQIMANSSLTMNQALLLLN